MRLARVLLALLAGVSALATDARADLDVLERDWIEVSSEHFTILSSANEERTRALAEDLEVFRQVVQIVAGARRLESPVPTRILVIDRPRDWMEVVGGSVDVQGFLAPGMRDAWMILRGESTMDGTDIVQHEFVHLLLRNESGIRYPRWYDEGFAELLATTGVSRGGVLVGRVPTRRLPWLQHGSWVPIRKVVDAGDYASWSDEDKAMFYAESWALVHFLVFGSDDADARKSRFDAYLARLRAGEEPSRAFETAFETRLSALDYRLRKYLERGVFKGKRIPVENFPVAPPRAARDVPPREVALAIGALQLRLGRWDESLRSFARAARLDPSSGLARSGIGRALAGMGRLGDARPHLDAGVRLAPEEPTVHLDRGHVGLHAAESSFEDDERRATIEAARRDLLRAWKLDDTSPEVYALNGYSYLVLGDDPARAEKMLEHAARLLPSDLTIRSWLAEAFLAVGRDDEAERAARTALVWSREGSGIAWRARDVLAMLDALRRREAEASAAATR
jgi:tetratricopeptide (TPR) repeat protein